MSGSPGATGLVGGAKTQYHITAEAKETFLAAVREGHTLKKAAELAGGYTRSAFSTHLVKRDPEFGAALKEALKSGTDSMVEEARRRAIDGWDEPVFRQSGEVGAVRKYDSTLLMFLIKQRDPSFRENARLEIGGEGGGPVEVRVRHDYGELLDGLERIGLLRGVAGVVDAEAGGGADRPALLPARAD